MALETELKKLNFSDKEARVYLALLELGEAPVQKIAEKAKVNRATTYVILESLKKKTAARTIKKQKRKIKKGSYCFCQPVKGGLAILALTLRPAPNILNISSAGISAFTNSLARLMQ